MANLQRWCWIPLLLLAFLAAATPAVLQAKPVPAPAPAAAPAPQNQPSATVVRTTNSNSEVYQSWRRQQSSHAENLALCAATGFAGGFTVFLCISGWGLFRVAMPKNFAVGALLSATGASFAGFAMGFTGFLQIVGS
jgi:hypothetical protein